MYTLKIYFIKLKLSNKNYINEIKINNQISIYFLFQSIHKITNLIKQFIEKFGDNFKIESISS